MLVKNQLFDLVLLDVMLPGKDGFTVARELRQQQNFAPILMLTARGRPEDILKGFESGADDYLPKPFNLDILVARIGGLLRRTNWLQTVSEVPPPAPDEVNFAGKTVDFQKLQLHNGKQVYQLTLMETELLRYLIRNNGPPGSRKEILEQGLDFKE